MLLTAIGFIAVKQNPKKVVKENESGQSIFSEFDRNGIRAAYCL